MGTSFLTYFYRVYIPKSKSSESFSSYDRKSERKFQTFFWICVVISIGALGLHAYALWECADKPRANICYSNLYTWAGYTFMMGLVMTVAIVLHYGYDDPEEHEPEFRDIDDITYEDEDDDIL